MIYKIAWGLSLIFAGCLIAGFIVPAAALFTGIALIVAGIAFLANA